LLEVDYRVGSISSLEGQLDVVLSSDEIALCDIGLLNSVISSFIEVKLQKYKVLWCNSLRKSYMLEAACHWILLSIKIIVASNLRSLRLELRTFKDGNIVIAIWNS
jgi:hypothetical protein